MQGQKPSIGPASFSVWALESARAGLFIEGMRYPIPINRTRTYESRTLARSRQIEAEQRAATSRPQPRSTGSFSDIPEEDASAEALQDDQIDFLDTESGPDYYRDNESDDGTQDVFKYGDGDDEEEAIGLDKQQSKR